MYFEFQKAKIQRNIGVKNINHTQNQSDFQNFFARRKQVMNENTINKIYAIIVKIPNIQLINALIVVANSQVSQII